MVHFWWLVLLLAVNPVWLLLAASPLWMLAWAIVCALSLVSLTVLLLLSCAIWVCISEVLAARVPVFFWVVLSPLLAVASTFQTGVELGQCLWDALMGVTFLSSWACPGSL